MLLGDHHCGGLLADRPQLRFRAGVVHRNVEPTEAVNARTLQRNPARQEIERQRTETEAAISDELTQFHPDAPEVKDLKKRLAARRSMYFPKSR